MGRIEDEKRFGEAQRRDSAAKADEAGEAVSKRIIYPGSSVCCYRSALLMVQMVQFKP